MDRSKLKALIVEAATLEIERDQLLEALARRNDENAVWMYNIKGSINLKGVPLDKDLDGLCDATFALDFKGKNKRYKTINKRLLKIQRTIEKI